MEVTYSLLGVEETEKKKAHPEVLWHYTTIEALTGICTEKRFRATLFSFLNDFAEVNAVSDAIRAKLSELKNEKLKEFAEWYESQHESCYIISLTEAKDSIPHWNEYTSKLNGGVAIGFSILQNNSNDLLNQILQCQYYDSTDNIASFFYDRLLEFFDCEYEDLPDDKLNILHESGYKLICALRHIPLLKHSNFSYEKEWRMLLRPEGGKNEMSFCNRKPYLSVETEKRLGKITKIMLSPYGDVELNCRYCELLIENHLLPNDTIICKSNATIRNFGGSK